MDHRFAAKLGISLPLLGFGTMRLPTDQEGNPLPEPGVALLEEALAAGINYFDTAYPYHGGKSEAFLGQHFFGRQPREKFLLATKFPAFRFKAGDSMEALFQEQLAKLQVEYIDFYLAHGLDSEIWAKFKASGGIDFLRRLKQDGKVRFIGFSFHGWPEELQAILEDELAWDFVQLQINYFDWPAQGQNAQAQYQLAADHGLPIVVMEPVRGGALARLPEAAEAILRAANPDLTPSQWALRWVAGLPAVAVVLSGMNEAAQLRENIATYTDCQPLNAAELQALDQVVELLYQAESIPCTGCDYCAADCPQKIRISYAFDHFNSYLRLQNTSYLERYRRMVTKDKQVENCLDCGACSKLCPQKIDIPGQLAAFKNTLTKFESASV